MKSILLGLGLILTSISFAANSNEVVINPGKYKDFYHLEFELTDKNSTLKLGSRDNQFYKGMFEVYIDKRQFPVPAPNCRSHIILRMPMSWDLENQKLKQQLFEQIKTIYRKENSSKKVIVELNPYMTINQNDQISLSHCNVFFRHANGAYVDHLKNLKPKRNF